MILLLRKANEGPTAQDIKRGDIEFVRDDSQPPSIGETTFWLCVQVPRYSGDTEELLRPAFEPGPPGEDSVQRHARAYCVQFWNKAKSNEVGPWSDPGRNTGLVIGRFDLNDIVQKT